MPVREDLLRPVSEEMPAGINLAYDKVFDQIKEARTEEDHTIPTGNWARPLKKADWPAVLRLAGDALAARSKDLRLAGWYGEALLRAEGIATLPALLALLHELQKQFWDALYPAQDEDGDLGLRVGALEAAAGPFAAQLRQTPVTRNGIRYQQLQEARLLGSEGDATTQEKKDARADAVQRGKVLLEDVDKALAETPKAFFATLEVAVREAEGTLEQLNNFHEQQYGDDPPSFGRLKSALEEVGRFISSTLAQKRATEPDQPSPQETEGPPSPSLSEPDAIEVHAPDTVISATDRASLPPALPSTGTSLQAAVHFFLDQKKSPESAYLIAAAPGLAEVFRAGPDHAWPAPIAGVRQKLRQLANQQQWAALERAAILALADAPDSFWLDLHRYVWRAAEALQHAALALGVLATVRSCLQQLPSLAKALLEDETPMATMDTQTWLRGISDAAEDGLALLPALRQSSLPPGTPLPDTFSRALAMVRQGRIGEAVGLLTHDAEAQPSGRLRFERRLQAAELCVEAKLPAVAQPLLADLMAEVERRTLDGWEAGSLLGKPLALMIRCVDLGVTASDSRDTLFARLCRLDPVEATKLATPGEVR